MEHKAGTHGTVGGIEIGKKVSTTTYTDYTKFLGQEIVGKNGFTYRFVRTLAALTAAQVQKMALCYVLAVDQADLVFNVQRAVLGGAISLKRVCGFGVEDQVALDAGDAFYMIVDGPQIYAILGDDAADVAIGEYVGIDDDADTGKLKSTDTTFDGEYTLGCSLDVATADDASFRFRPIRKLRG